VYKQLVQVNETLHSHTVAVGQASTCNTRVKQYSKPVMFEGVDQHPAASRVFRRTLEARGCGSGLGVWGLGVWWLGVWGLGVGGWGLGVGGLGFGIYGRGFEELGIEICGLEL